jgi:hypothetical protein
MSLALISIAPGRWIPLKVIQVMTNWLRLLSKRVRLDVYRSRVGIRKIIFRRRRIAILSGSIKGIIGTAAFIFHMREPGPNVRYPTWRTSRPPHDR